MLFLAVVLDFAGSSCFDQTFVYSWNHPIGKSEIFSVSSLNFYLSHFLNNHKGQYPDFVVFTVEIKYIYSG